MSQPRDITIYKILFYKHLLVTSSRTNSFCFIFTYQIMDLYKFFPKDGSKKRDLSDQSNNGDEPKRQFEDSVADLILSDEVFLEENLQSSRVIGILLNVLNKLEKQVAEIYQISDTTKTSQIKGEEQLNDVLQTVKFINAKFDEFEKDKKEKEEQIKNLESEVTKMKEEIIDLKRE